MRTTTHNGRTRADGSVYNTKHNDRRYDISKSDNIHPAQTGDNQYFYWCKKDRPGLSFDQAESLYYKQYLSQSLEAQNARHIANRHPERVIDIEQYRKSPRTCPEETILQIGRTGDTVDPKVIQKIAAKYTQWHRKAYPQCKILTFALHVDETTPHVHIRKVWTAHDKDGLLTVSQTKALAEMGIQRPDPDKRDSKYNNAKMTYTAQCRSKFNDICMEHGISVELTPKEPSKSGLSQLEYQTQQESAKLDDMRQQIQLQQAEIEALRASKEKYEQYLKKAKETIEKAQNRVQELDGQSQQLELVSRQLEAESKELARVLELKEQASRIHEPSTLEKVVFKRDEVTYDRDMVDQIRAIGDKVSADLKAIESKSRDLDKREQMIAKHEAEIEPLHRSLEREKGRLDGLIRDQEQLITQKAKGLQNRRMERLEDFCKSVTYKDGSTVLDHFEQHEKEIRHQHNWGISR